MRQTMLRLLLPVFVCLAAINVSFAAPAPKAR